MSRCPGILCDKTADTLGVLSSGAIADVLALLLDLPAHEVRRALLGHGVLARFGLLNVDRSGTALLAAKLALLSRQFAESILGSETDPIALLRDPVVPSTPPRLQLADFHHLNEALAILRPYLAQAVAGNRHVGPRRASSTAAMRCCCSKRSKTSSNSSSPFGSRSTAQPRKAWPT
ncbi:hypothetical protein [Massilia sp. BSC265]|uniref:hypothetical protein n=1 Tax=Massilia sp. BSC265 TaxID=1549812 RepID=UPI0004E8C424|nr:hypothetical protein [Massilia sp. BSC265]KFI08313.1 hypothetical protein JN27_05805 [Massilia sp. BSC265]